MTNDARVQTLLVDEHAEGKRLDRWLTDALTDLDYDVSRSQVQLWIDEDRVQGPKQRVKANDVVTVGATYTVAIPEPVVAEILGEDVALTVVHEDADVVVVNKPRGLVVHPAAGHPTGTLINGLVGRGITLSALGGTLRPGVVHRIDKDTSGLIVFAKTDLAYHRLSEQLRDHSMDRIYLAIVHGNLKHPRALIDAPIGRDPRNRQRMAVVAGGKQAITHVQVLDTFPDYAYVQLRLETGRTHQIRVHLATIGHPLVGDPVYGPARTLAFGGQALHATTLGFVHPSTGERISFEAPLPDDMVHLLNDLRTPGGG